jgi:hypothetical protein
MMRGSTSITQSRISASSSTTIPLLVQQQRHTGRYLQHEFTETRQPRWLANRQEGRSFVSDYIAQKALPWKNAERAPLPQTILIFESITNSTRQ